MRARWVLGKFCLVLASIALAATALAADDPFAHCAAAGVDDQTRSIPAPLAEKAIALFGFPADSAKWAQATTVYRCMSGDVWLCNHGANLSCDKGDTHPSPARVEAFCHSNPTVEMVPMAVTGHDTIHSFGCAGGKPRILQSQALDGRGFIADQWRRLEK